MAASDTVPKNSQNDGVLDIDITGEASYYAAENFELCDEKTDETCYYYDDGGNLSYYCAAVSFDSIHISISLFKMTWLIFNRIHCCCQLVDGGCTCPAGQKKCDACKCCTSANFACLDSQLISIFHVQHQFL